MTIKIMPVTGLPMPFISYGGSSLITWFALLGLVQASTCAACASEAPVGSPDAPSGSLVTAMTRTLAADRAAPGTGAEAGSLHRLRGRRRHPSARAREGVLAARLPRRLRGRPAQPGPADPLRDPQRARRRRRRADVRALDRPRRRCCASTACRCSPSTPTGPPATSTCWRSTCRPSWSSRTSSRCSTWPACRCTPPTAAAEHPLVVVGGHSAFNPEPLADFVDLVVLGDGEEVVGEITTSSGLDRGGPRRPRRRAARSWPRCRACTCRRCTTSPTTARRSSPSRPASPTSRRTVDKRTVADLGAWPYPKHQLVPLTEVVHDRLNVEVFRGLHRGLPVLPGRDDHPPGPRAARRPGAHDGRRRPAPHGLRRGRPDVAVDGRLERRRAASSAASSPIATPRRRAARRRSTCRRCASTPSPSASPGRSPQGGAAGSRSPPRPARGGCAR